MRRLFLCFSILGFLLISPGVFSQTQGVLSHKWYGNWSIGVAGGPLMYYGHLSVHDYWPVSETPDGWRYAGTAYLMRQFSHVFALRGQFMYGEIAGSKRSYTDGTPYDRYFTGSLMEYTLNSTFNLSNMLFRYKPKRVFFIYATFGAGMTNWSTTIRDLATHDPAPDSVSAKNWTIVVPGGLGFYFNIADRVNLGLEWTIRAINSEILRASTSSGGFQYDMYSLLSFNLVFNLNRRNQVKLDAVNATMPPVVFPNYKNPAVETPREQKPAAATGTGAAAKPSTGQPAVIPRELIQPLTDTIVAGTASPTVTDTVPVSPRPFQLPGLEADIFYRVQIYSAPTGERSERNVQVYFKLNQPVVKELTEGYYRYYVGEFENENEAKQFATSLRTKPGLKGAFVVKYINGTRELTHPK